LDDKIKKINISLLKAKKTKNKITSSFEEDMKKRRLKKNLKILR